MNFMFYTMACRDIIMKKIFYEQFCVFSWKAGQDERIRDGDLETKAFFRGLKSVSPYEEPQSVDSAIQSYGKR